MQEAMVATMTRWIVEQSDDDRIIIAQYTADDKHIQNIWVAKEDVPRLISMILEKMAE